MAQRAAGAVTEPPEPRGSWEEPVGRAVLRLLEVVEVASFLSYGDVGDD